MINAWDNPDNKEYLRQAFHHHPYHKDWEEALNTRMGVIRNMVRAFDGYPEVLAHLATAGVDRPDIPNWWETDADELRPQVEYLAEQGRVDNPAESEYKPTGARDRLTPARRQELDATSNGEYRQK
jgi:hypothetical protein